MTDPKEAAPPLDPGAATSVYDATKFLYTGANPIQRDVEPGAIEPKQVAILRGQVKDRSGEPIGGVRVTVLDHPELGETNTRADGAFDIAVKCTCGCGDAFNAGFAVGLVSGFDIEGVIRFAQATAALNATGLGSQAGVESFAHTLAFSRSTRMRAA